MFEKFTDRARRVIVLAQEEARMLNHGFIGTEHLLLGLSHEGEGIAARALEAVGISLEAVREQVAEIIGRGEGQPAGHIPFTPRAKKVLELSLREALQLGHDYIGTEHILLGLIREGEGVAAQVMVRLGLDLNRVRRQVIELAGAPGGDAPETTPTAWAGRRGPIAFRREREVTGRLVGQVTAIEARLAAVERRVGTGPDMRDLDEQIARVRDDKRSATTGEDYEQAAALRDRERQLQADKSAREAEWSDLHPGLADLADRLRALAAEVERLRRLIEPPGTGSAVGP
jgi:ATP-dependent Clp protease ATP-binding subunit ClpA